MKPENNNQMQARYDQSQPGAFNTNQPDTPIPPQQEFPSPSPSNSKLKAVVLGGVLILFGIAVGVFLLVQPGDNKKSNNQADETTVEQEDALTAGPDKDEEAEVISN